VKVREPRSLFFETDIFGIQSAQQRKLDEEIASYDGDALLSVSMDRLLDYFEKKYELDVPELVVDKIEVDVDERSRNVGGIFESYPQTGAIFIYHVPYSGSQGFFRVRPSSYNINPPRGFVTEGELQLTFERLGEADRGTVKDEAERLIQQVQSNLDQLRLDVGPFNSGLRDVVRARVEARRNRLLADRKTAASLGYPVRLREGATRTYSVAIERKRVIPTAPRGSGAPFEPEPALDSEAYERALHTCANMAQILEESPSTFANTTETFIRDLLVVMLNDQFTSATRETFRAAGKTDILIDVKGRAIFIAECKFYKGPQSITDALHQLLGYGTWRDTKLALLVFSRHKDFSDVLRKIDESVRGYVQFKRAVEYSSESGFRYVLKHKDDVDREMQLTVLAFAIPLLPDRVTNPQVR
jgi:hypothetical protein